MLLVRSEDDYKNKSYIESALHFSLKINGNLLNVEQYLYVC